MSKKKLLIDYREYCNTPGNDPRFYYDDYMENKLEMSKTAKTTTKVGFSLLGGAILVYAAYGLGSYLIDEYDKRKKERKQKEKEKL
ncbi:hypothetical protein [Paenibacillus sacheonensis]|uniref:Uncharacterized protein n=1 Tax=Paenibacillus sacheonensis TaxID=742054 RepID=A0A7X4YXK6_9BACL|nr:hypothetical protein [Paenibacillus sacheonensis]MBM7564306.1 hypothetical protein [Paenibacillus sacheonensis]NBC73461.1 hypothetical protein [Paenibacillus sacheonensis]